MDQNILDRLGIRYDEGVARCGGRAELYEQHLLRLPQDLTFSLLRRAIAEKNSHEAVFQARTLQVILEKLCLEKLCRELTPLAEKLVQLEDPTLLAGEFSVFGRHFEQTMAELKAQQP